MEGRERLNVLIHSLHKQARQYAKQDLTSALNKCRTICEVILSRELYEKKSRDPKGIPLDKLITQLQNDIPHLIHAHCRAIQAYGNFGSHFQLGEGPSEAAVVACLAATGDLIKWFDPEHRPIDSEPVQVEAEQIIDEDAEAKPSESIRSLMHKMVKEKELDFEDTISLREIREWFLNLDSGHKESSIMAHVQMMTTNGESRLFHDLAKDGSDELFFRVRKGQYRLYNRDLDPEPILEVEQFSGWENNLLIVNTSKSLEVVMNSCVYLSPNRTRYKLKRSKYIGLYSNKAVQYIAEIVSKVTFRTEKSKGWVWWKNSNLDDSDLISLASERVHSIRPNWDNDLFPVQAIIFKNPIKVDFKADYPMQNNNRVFPNKGAETVEELSEMISKVSWNEWLGK